MKEKTNQQYGVSYLTYLAELESENTNRLTIDDIKNYFDNIEEELYGSITDRLLEVDFLEKLEDEKYISIDVDDLNDYTYNNIADVDDFIEFLEPIFKDNYIVKINFYFEIEQEI